MQNAPTVTGATQIDESALFLKISLRLLPFLFILYVVAYLDRMNVSFAGLQMRRDLASAGLDAQAFGLGSGIFFLGYFIFEIPSNLILQRVGARRWIARIMLTWGVIATGTMFVRGPRSFYAIRFALGLAEAGFFPGVILYLTYWYPAARRARAVAIFMTATAASGVIGSLISSAILGLDGVANLHGWQWVFLLEGVPAILLTFVVLRLLPDHPRDAHWLSEEERATLAGILSREDGSSVHRTSELPSAFVSPRVWLLTAVYFTISLSMYCVSFWLPQLILAVWPRHTDRQVTLMSACPYAIAAMAMILIGKSSDHTGERRLHVALSLVAAAAGAAISAASRSPVAGLIGFSLVTLGVWSAIGPFWGIPPMFLSGIAAAAGIALINSFGNLGGFLGPYIFGTINKHTGSFTAAFWMLAGILALGAAMALLLKSESQA